MAESIYKLVEIDGEQFSIKKFTAMTGLQIAKFLIGKASTIIPIIETGNTDDESVAAVMEVVNTVSDAELTDLVSKCLKVCYKVMPAGYQAVMDSAGRYGVEGIEYDMMKTIKLCVEAITWGAADFFAASGSNFNLSQGLTGFQPHR